LRVSRGCDMVLIIPLLHCRPKKPVWTAIRLNFWAKKKRVQA
jgi:hypothetical protein